ncbi:hypothetical protein Lpar_1441 [Legionella parisiensis]|uniref:Uncharacterized protein n=1 Tax=Legionella parisiensis TaxID=45071 RepID=A0A1E5JVS1_9GAMM|nr:hypothetical protein Lpar_1441 [Legionella parisiensis]OEH48634.1 hypothetical protein lpari_00393 [Legionella parisiensis]STX77331.1 Uncharacterised protein [Legionella parisiensis]
MHSMSVYFKDKSSTADFVDAVPDKCPICHHKISPQLEIALYSTHDIPCRDIDVVWRCPNHQCNRLYCPQETTVSCRLTLGSLACTSS